MLFEVKALRLNSRFLGGLLAASTALAGCTSDGTTVEVPTTGPSYQPPAPVADVATRPPSWEPATEPGAGLCFGDLPGQNGACHASWGEVLTDLLQHVPHGWKAPYDDFAVEYARNATRTVNRYLRHYFSRSGQAVNAFYLLNGRFVTLPEPAIRKSDVAAFVPPSLRGPLFDELIVGRSDLDHRPLFVLDEWVAHTNGGAVALDRIGAGLWRAGQREALYGQLELTVYSLALLRAVEARDPRYFAEQDQLWELVAHEARRSMEIYRSGRSLPELRSYNQETYERVFRQAGDAVALRDFARRVFGDRWAAEVLGVQ